MLVHPGALNRQVLSDRRSIDEAHDALPSTRARSASCASSHSATTSSASAHTRSRVATRAPRRTRSQHLAPSDYVVGTSTGRKHNPSNLRRDVLAPAVVAANVTLNRAGIAPIEGVTFHSLRRTYASLRCACGDDVRYAADQLGHEDPRFTLRVYAQATKRRDRLSGPHLRAYDAALEWARMGTSEALTVPTFEIQATEKLS